MSSSVTVSFKINISEEQKKKLNIDNNQIELLNKFWNTLREDLRQNLDEDGGFDNAQNISNVLMNKLLASFKNKNIVDFFIENAKYGSSVMAITWPINFKTPENFSRFVIFFEKLSEEQQKIFLNFSEKIYQKNLYLTNRKDAEVFLSNEYIQMIINIFSEKYKNIDSYYKKLVEKDGFTNNFEIEEEIELNKIINDKTFEKLFNFFLKDYNEKDLEEISKKNFIDFLNCIDFISKKDIEEQQCPANIEDEKEREKARNKIQEIISCMKKKAEIIKSFFEKEFGKKPNILENKTSEIKDKAEINTIPNSDEDNKSEQGQSPEINGETAKKPDTPHDYKKKNPNHMKALITGSTLIAFDALLIGVLAKTKGVPNLFENRMINLGLIICASMLLIAAEALIVKKVYNLEIKNIDNLEYNKQMP